MQHGGDGTINNAFNGGGMSRKNDYDKDGAHCRDDKRISYRGPVRPLFWLFRVLGGRMGSCMFQKRCGRVYVLQSNKPMSRLNKMLETMAAQNE